MCFLSFLCADMNIFGFTKTTLLDYPGHVAATIFTGSCNFRCPFCHNYDLVLNPEVFPKEDEDLILRFLEKRHGVLTGVAITGGEPTLQPDLADYIRKIKSLGYLVKLDTNGFKPDVLLSLLDANLLDYVAMDIKSGRQTYGTACGIAGIDIDRIEESVRILGSNRIPYEFRTTVVGGLHNDSDFKDIANWLPTDCNYFLQGYKDTQGIGDHQFTTPGNDDMNHYLDIVKEKIPSSSLRGIE